MTVVLGYVDRPEGKIALETAAEEAKVRGSKLIIVNAVRGESTVEATAVNDDDINAIKTRLEGQGVSVQVLQPLGPDVAESVLKAAEEHDAALIVIGLRKRSPVGKLFLGSAAQNILLNAFCPVLAVKAT